MIAMPSFSNLKDVEKYLQKKVSNALVNEVAQSVKETEAKIINDTVYDVYEPRYYVRRFDNGGLSDTDNMKSELVEDGVLIVTNETPPNPNYPHRALRSTVAEVVEYGDGYTFYNPGSRPFTRNTVNELERTGDHITALRDGLRRQGIKTD
jgi:hypothetical protein